MFVLFIRYHVFTYTRLKHIKNCKIKSSREEMKIFSLTVLVFFSVTNAHSQFRGYDWGTSPSSIKSTEGEPAFDDKDNEQLLYEGEIAGFDAVIAYGFINNSLQSGTYLFTDDYSSEMRYLANFREINSLITQRYGEPSNSDPRIVLDSSYEDNEYIDEGTKLSMGAIGYQSIWNLDGVIILHSLKGNNYEVRHGLSYKSEAYDKLKEQQKVSDF